MNLSPSATDGFVDERPNGIIVAFATDGTRKEFVMKGKLKDLRALWRQQS